MSLPSSKVNIAVADRILLHLWEQDHQADHYLVSREVTRPGIAEICALHPPNVSRTMSDLASSGLVSEHTRVVRGEERRQKTWQLTDEGREEVRRRIDTLREIKVLLRERGGNLLEVRADEVGPKLETGLTLLQVLMHAQHEGVLNYGDIRFGAIIRSENDEMKKPGSLKLLAGAHSTYHTRPPETRTVHGREAEVAILDEWFESNAAMAVVSGIAGCGKTTLASYWLNHALNSNPEISVMYYPCQPWDSTLGIATSLLHRLEINSDESGDDPYGVLESLPMKPGASIDIDLYRRRLIAHLLDEEGVRGETTKDILVILDDVHNIGAEGGYLFGALLQIAETTAMRLLLVSRTNLTFYDRRDVHTRGRVVELRLTGLSLEEVSAWISSIELPSEAPAEEIYRATGGHPLAVELLELYGKTLHEDWLRFLDEEILEVLPNDRRELLALLAVADRPVPWDRLAEAADYDGVPPEDLITRGLMLELEDGMWLHEALRSRLLREVGAPLEERANKLRESL
ncbi:MAG: AAA family ATPase [Candidatus Thalassarchaeaceae archaeon]|jgi:DNA-binding PadR family transcriptional regulator/DNA-binding transcriptional MerR regulator|nr:AAA family ATPase [Candidatus Thalassarchaeaceae archaeon]HIH80342.1 AAA family ATPase [Candidatus Thalassarchaeaceae archaeon]|tara:strand:- start:909 stop:2456 length:1548 start_codon:yes stop_codon:yes gene_type:complete